MWWIDCSFLTGIPKSGWLSSQLHSKQPLLLYLLPWFLWSFAATILFVFWVTQTRDILYAHARSNHSQRWQFCIWVIQYRVFREVWDHVTGNGIHSQKETSGPASRVLYSSLWSGSYCNYGSLCCAHRSWNKGNEKMRGREGEMERWGEEA